MTVPDIDRQPTLRHLEQLMAQLLDGVILLDATGVILSANSAALHMHGVRTLAELGGTAEDYARRFTLWSADHRRLKHREYPLFRVLAGERIPDMVVEVAPAGEDQARWVLQARDVILDVDGGEPDYLAVVLNDVSKQYDAEARFNAMFNANPAPAIVVRQRDLYVVQVNSGFLELTGFKPKQLVGRSLFGLDLLGSLSDRLAVREQMETGDVVSPTDAELLTANGARRLVLFAGQPIDVTDEDAVLLTFADLEPRREAERSLADSERHLQAVFEMAPVAMAVTRDMDHRITSMNAAFRDLTGFEADEALNQTPMEAGLWHDIEQGAQMEAEVEQVGSLRGREARLVSQACEHVDCLVAAETINVRGTPCVLWVFENVTDRRRSEAELVAAIDEALQDASWLSRSIMDKLATLRRPPLRPSPAELSHREREVLDLVCDDLDDRTIATQLGISRNTVRNHVASIYTKIGTNRRSGAVVWGRERGMGSKRN